MSSERPFARADEPVEPLTSTAPQRPIRDLAKSPSNAESGARKPWEAHEALRVTQAESRLLELLESRDPADPLWSLRLQELGPAGLGTLLRLWLREPDQLAPEVAREALEALAGLFPGAELENDLLFPSLSAPGAASLQPWVAQQGWYVLAMAARSHSTLCPYLLDHLPELEPELLAHLLVNPHLPHDRHEEVRRRLAQSRYAPALVALLAALPEEGRREEAVAQSYLARALPASLPDDEEAARSMIQGVGELFGSRACPAFRSLLGSASQALRPALAAELAALGDAQDLPTILDEFKRRPYPALHSLLRMGEEARAALPALQRRLADRGWERWGAEDWEERELLKDGWSLFCRWALDAELQEALDWPNTRAVVEASRELWRRGHPVEPFLTRLLMVVAGGTWGLMAGGLLRDMGPDCQSLDAALFLVLEQGRPAAARALGARHPEAVVRVARALPGDDEAVEALVQAGPETLPALLLALCDRPGPARDRCQRALLELDPQALRGCWPACLRFPYDLDGSLAALLARDALQLIDWAGTAQLGNLCKATWAERPWEGVDPEPFWSRQETAFWSAIMSEPPELGELREGLWHPQVEVVWCSLVAARKVDRLTPDLEARVLQLAEHPEEAVREEAQKRLSTDP